MSYNQDFLSILTGAFAMMWGGNRASLLLVLVGGIALAGLCWWGCSRFSSLWNKEFKVTLIHHLMCATAALITLISALIFAALKHALPAAQVSVGVWEVQIRTDKAWEQQVFNDAYWRVKGLNLEDFANYPPPPTGNGVPVTHERSKLETAVTYAEAGAAHFNRSRPYLSSITAAQSEVPRDVLKADVTRHFKTSNTSYSRKDALSLVVREVRKGIDENLPRIVTSLRIKLIVICIVAQLIPFAVIGLAGHRELRAV